jgi:hypothetical protein
MQDYLVKDTHALVQQLAMRLLNHGYHFYSTSWIPESKDPRAVDVKLLLRYGGYLSKFAVHRRHKQHGAAKVRYLRCGRLVVLVATAGGSPFWDCEGRNIRDARESPLHVAGYALSPTRVRLHREVYNRLARQYLDGWAVRRSAAWLEEKLRALPFDPGYAGVRAQVVTLARALNVRRKAARLPPVAIENCFRTKRLAPRKVYLPIPDDVRQAVELYAPTRYSRDSSDETEASSAGKQLAEG